MLAAIGIGANVARGVQADRVNDQTDFAVSLSTLVHELQRERDLSAGWVGSGRDAGYGGVVAQRVAVNQALQTFRRDVENLGADEGSAVLQQRVETALRQFNRLNDERLQIEDEAAWTVPRTLDFYSGLIANLFAVECWSWAARPTAAKLTRNIATFVALGRLKEAASQERGLVYAVASAGKFAPGEFQRFATSLGAQDTWRAQFDATASARQRARLDALQSQPRRRRGQRAAQLPAQRPPHRGRQQRRRARPQGMVPAHLGQDRPAPWMSRTPWPTTSRRPARPSRPTPAARPCCTRSC